MRMLVAGITVISLAIPIIGEAQDVKIWTGREGICSDWAVTWKMTKQSDQSYSGDVNQIHQGGPCPDGKGTGRSLTGTAEASISGNTITAHVAHADGNDCNYQGTISGTKVTGTQNCGNAMGTPWTMTIIKQHE
jgi:hypothetical protein